MKWKQYFRKYFMRYYMCFAILHLLSSCAVTTRRTFLRDTGDVRTEKMAKGSWNKDELVYLINSEVVGEGLRIEVKANKMVKRFVSYDLLEWGDKEEVLEVKKKDYSFGVFGIISGAIFGALGGYLYYLAEQDKEDMKGDNPTQVTEDDVKTHQYMGGGSLILSALLSWAGYEGLKEPQVTTRSQSMGRRKGELISEKEDIESEIVFNEDYLPKNMKLEVSFYYKGNEVKTIARTNNSGSVTIPFSRLSKLGRNFSFTRDGLLYTEHARAYIALGREDMAEKLKDTAEEVGFGVSVRIANCEPRADGSIDGFNDAVGCEKHFTFVGYEITRKSLEEAIMR